ncbi:MAG: SDR family NAD(P)-dependent oxidoreductase [Actinomycetota bacterium]|nr:SDR family NAD(P)-dependent oxidoreductase [Actinomycetota bacterium]
MSAEPQRPTVPNVAGRVVVITGASRGIGAGLAARFAELGMHLAVCARHRPEPPPGVHGPVVTAAVDVTDADAVDELARRVDDELGPIDLWINNAGLLGPLRPVRDQAPADNTALLAVNVGGVLNGSATYIRHRRAHGGGGVLVNVSSGAARRGMSGWGPYAASKAAVERISEAVAEEEADSGLRVLAVAPGVVDTAMQAAIRATPEADFPDVARFRRLGETGAFNDVDWVADHLATWAFDETQAPDAVLCRVPDQHER